MLGCKWRLFGICQSKLGKNLVNGLRGVHSRAQLKREPISFLCFSSKLFDSFGDWRNIGKSLYSCFILLGKQCWHRSWECLQWWLVFAPNFCMQLHPLLRISRFMNAFLVYTWWHWPFVFLLHIHLAINDSKFI